MKTQIIRLLIGVALFTSHESQSLAQTRTFADGHTAAQARAVMDYRILGVGIGSKLEDVKKAYPNVTVTTEGKMTGAHLRAKYVDVTVMFKDSTAVATLAAYKSSEYEGLLKGCIDRFGKPDHVDITGKKASWKFDVGLMVDLDGLSVEGEAQLAVGISGGKK